MEYRQLGRTGVQVSVFSLGAMNFGPWGNDDEADCARIVHGALDAGVNLIDTADVYGGGRSEEIVGKALKGRRDEVVLATKFHNPMGSGPNDRGNSRLWITRAVEGSLRRLQVDHIDLYQIHRPDPSVDIEETLGVLSELVTAGKIRYFGTTTFPASLLVETVWASVRRGFSRPASEQPPYSILVRHSELEVLPTAAFHGLGTIVWSPLAGGWLAGKYRKQAEAPAGSRGREGRMMFVAPRFDLALEANRRKQDLVESLEAAADRADLPLMHMALAFPLAHPAVTSVIVGPRTADQLPDVLAAADVRLPADCLDAIDEIVPPGTTINDADRGWNPPWMTPEARRRA